MSTLCPPHVTSKERPAVFADRIGQQYARSVSGEYKKRHGQYLTPVEVADFMAGLCATATDCVRILDPGAGTGILSCALCEALTMRTPCPDRIELETYETDTNLLPALETSLAYLKEWLCDRDITLNHRIHRSDFVLAQASVIEDVQSLFEPEKLDTSPFDIVICNPPYFKIAKSDPRSHAAETVVHGQPNIYALFMAVSARLLKQGGELIFITPRSYAAGPYFRLFRQRFFAEMRPESLLLFGSRKEAFRRDEVLQENIILRARRDDGWSRRIDDRNVTLYISRGIQDLTTPACRHLPLPQILNLDTRDSILCIPETDEQESVSRLVRSWSGSLRSYGIEISTGPVVAFRAIAFLSEKGLVPETHVPLLWLQNVTPMQVLWPTSSKEQYIALSPASRALLVPRKNYVFLRRFSSKEQARRLIAAPLLESELIVPFVGLENHLNYIYRPGGNLSPAEAYGLAALLNSRLLDDYFRSFNGNTQVSATELRAMPFPPLEAIQEIGQRFITEGMVLQNLDALVESVLLSASRKPSGGKQGHACY